MDTGDRASRATEEETVIEGIMGGGAMMGGMGWDDLLIGLLVVLSVAALVKYLFFGTRP